MSRSKKAWLRRYGESPELQAAILAAKFAQEIGLTAGNMWEPGIARNLVKAWHEIGDWALIEHQWRSMLGLASQ